MKYLMTFKKALLGGLYIGIGCTIYLYLDNKIAGAFLFGLGLFTIITLGLNLFTGKIGYLSKETYKDILITLVGNFIGINVIALLMKQTRIGAKLIEAADSYAATKLSDTYPSLFILGIFCGVMMYTAYAVYTKYPNILGAIAIFLCVAVFILCGFEHCIADMYYFGMVRPFTDYYTQLIVVILGNATGAITLRQSMKNLGEQH